MIYFIIFIQEHCVIANIHVVLPNQAGFFHAVLYDQEKTETKNDADFYFKNSWGPTDPYLQIPKIQPTYFQHHNPQMITYSTIVQLFLLKIKHDNRKPASSALSACNYNLDDAVDMLIRQADFNETS